MSRFKFTSTRGYNIGEEIEYKGYKTTIVGFHGDGFVVMERPGYTPCSWKDETVDRMNGLHGERYTHQNDWHNIIPVLDNICGTCKNNCKDKDVETCPFYEEKGDE
jgi:hypothetical protein